MEHMPLPHGVRLGPDDAVPYVGGGMSLVDPYDGKPFLDFPERMHPSWAQLVSSVNARKAAGILHRRPQPSSPRLEVFAQRWLFFGLLHEVLGNAYRSEDFIDRTPSLPAIQQLDEPVRPTRATSWPLRPDGGSANMYITTAKLIGLVKDWMLRAKDPPGLGEAALRHVVACLDQAMTFLYGVCDAIRPSIRISIGSVINLFCDALEGLSLCRLPSVHPLNVYDREQLRRKILENGWCAKSLSTFGLEGWGSIQSWFYLSHMNLRAPGRDHGDCSATLCKAVMSSPNKYAKHVPDCSGNCKDIVIRGEDLTTILESDKLPVLSISNEGATKAPTVRLLPAADGQCHVAISHVWSDGLGNPDANSLPGCQISKVGRFVQILAMALSNDTRETYVWIDTLCCPSSAFPRGKINALAKMRETYQNARAVLVLDAGLQTVDSQEMTSLEICARVVTSGWTTRLWTMQEAALPKSLWAQFKGQARNVDAFISDKTLPHKHDLYRDLTGEMVGAWWGLRPGALMANKALQKPGRIFGSLCEGIRRRAVSFASDEPLCVAVLLGLPSKSIVELPAEDRMPELWRLIQSGGIIQWVVFLNRPKLAQPGFRWAPRTLMLGDLSDSDFELLAPASGSRYGTLCSEGLKVHYPGGIFHMAGRAKWLPQSFFRLTEDDLTLGRLRTSAGRWYFFYIETMGASDIEFFRTYNRGQVGNSSQRLALFWHPEFDYRRPKNVALGILAAFTRTDDSAGTSAHCVNFLRRVTMGLSDPAASVLFEAAHQAAVKLLGDATTSRLRELSDSSVPGDHNQSGAYAEAVAELRAEMTSAGERINAQLGLTGRPLTGGERTKVQETFNSIERSYAGYVGDMTMESPEPCCWCVD